MTTIDRCAPPVVFINLTSAPLRVCSIRQGFAPGDEQPSRLHAANASPLDHDHRGLRSPIGCPSTRIRRAFELPSWTRPHDEPRAGSMRATVSPVEDDQGFRPLDDGQTSGLDRGQ